jgi:hypothetical protein
MYDALTGRFTFACPSRGDARVALSSFRRVERLAGAAHPAVFRIRFACGCGSDHDGLVAHDELDLAPVSGGDARFHNLMTSRLEDVTTEFLDLAARLIRGGSWPWSFYCHLEERPRPVFPSSFSLLAPGERTLAVAVSCPACARTSVNLVSHAHLDVPFHHDREIGVVDHVFADDAAPTLEEFRAELHSWSFDVRRLALE